MSTKVGLIILNRQRMTWNKLIYGGQVDKKDNVRFWSGVSISLFCLLVVFGISMLICNVLVHIFATSIAQHVGSMKAMLWYNAAAYGLFYFLVYNGTMASVHKIIHSDDMESLVAAPITRFEWITAKLLEQSAVKILFQLVVVGIPLAWNWFWVMEPTILSGVLCILSVVAFILCTQLIKVLLISSLLLNKLRGKKSRGQMVVGMAAFFLQLTALIYIIYPFSPFLSDELGSYYNTMLEFSRFDQLIVFFGIWIWPHVWLFNALSAAVQGDVWTSLAWMLLFVLLGGFVISSCWKLLRRMESFSLITLNPALNPSSSMRSWAWAVSIVDRLSWIHPHTRTLLIKDLAHLSRESKHKSITMIGMLLLGFFIMIGIFYLTEQSLSPANMTREFMSIPLGMYGIHMITYALLDRFALDAEGRNIHVLLSSPIKESCLVNAKLLGILITATPASLITSSVVFLLYPVNPWLYIAAMVSAALFIASGALAAGATFPNFEYQSISELPSSRAKYLVGLLGSGYVFISGFLCYHIKSPVLLSGIFICCSLVGSWILVGVATRKLQEGEFESFGSLDEITK
ncbi:hypothetical protein [Paenibacillus mucilaginosus]|uniref:ABC-type transport system involved in multi-copper enzyme maturation, permease component n=1 Tax=Paenibacillus mucilaginosus (strain KNP414) TaxID=1036673 RepID=F8FLY8_PAEMK|nr:hypothetical protein [Paenibacillus mucilaginosus]AEI45614.1 ABC-type transport system involved in multi-copper enzyme maturation, permease component [Paenibacillus mucilaginosus KNP414]MCG7215359.1 hypothetical protein [Paenibacillus mucilaginosus]WDM27019.1 hypothetical protein KCX80_32235 [Paenibacillus mucilaginosus]